MRPFKAIFLFTCFAVLGTAVWIGFKFKDEKRTVADMFMHTVYTGLFFGQLSEPEIEVRFDDGTHEEKILAIRGRLSGLTPDMLDASLFTDLSVPMSDGHVHNVRMYHPGDYSKEERWKRWPVLLHIHGGGFCIGNYKANDLYLHDLATAANVLIFSVSYRFAPEHPFPQAPNDILDHYLWLREHADDYFGDVDRIAVGGDSAGANLAVVLTHDLRNLARQGKDVGSVKAQLINAPVLDGDLNTESYRNYGKLHGLTKQTMYGFLACYLGVGFEKIKDPRAFPLHGDLSSLPPALMFVYNHDPLCSEGEAYAEALQREGIPTELHILEGTHVSATIFPYFFHSEQYKTVIHASTKMLQSM